MGVLSKQLKKDYLENGKTKFEGMMLIMGTPGDIKVGDTYITGRNTKKKLLTAREIKDNLVFPVEPFEYPFNLHECYPFTFE